MSMDDQYTEMRRFYNDLVHFNEALRASMGDLTAHHEAVLPHWQDEMRRTYDLYWEPLEQQMEQYINKEGPEYERFLKSKIASLGRYLNGS
jgi:hypothetical protein